MPTYDYRCDNCSYTFEHFQSMMDDPLCECPSCKGTVKRLLTGGTGIIFKGSGFYVTDNRKSGKKETPAKHVDTPPATD